MTTLPARRAAARPRSGPATTSTRAVRTTRVSPPSGSFTISVALDGM